MAALRESLQAKRDKLGAALTDSASRCTTASAPTSCAPIPGRSGYDDSTAFCAELPERDRGGRDPDVGVLRSRSRRTPTTWNHLVRFAFCKRDDTLDEAIRRLAALRRN